MHCGYFDITRNSNHSSDTNTGWWGMSLRCQIGLFAESDPPPSKRRLRPISAYNVSTVRDSEKQFNYDEYKVYHVLSNEIQIECVVRYS